MAFEMLVGLNVVDQEAYARYRAGMTPLLEAAGGTFAHDFEVARTLKTAATHDINRVFVIRFPDRATRDQFFSSPAYLAVREQFFAVSVKGASRLAEYEC
ncbi:MAG: DUF1330 domain-containing protein [Bryobacterales bacterium]|nr:DUF1330 domain-containing protein [Bryobacterales bacterium]